MQTPNEPIWRTTRETRQLFNRWVIFCLLVAFPLIAVVLVVRSATFGLGVETWVQGGLAAAAGGLILARRRLPDPLFAKLLIVIGILYGFTGLVAWGLAGHGVLVITVFVILSAIVVGIRTFICYLALSSLATLFLGVFASRHLIAIGTDLNQYAASWASWFTATADIVILAGASAFYLLMMRKSWESSIQQLSHSESRYRLLAQNASDVIFTTDLAMNLTYISPSVERIRGYTPEEIRNIPIDRQMTPESFALAAGALEEELAAEQQPDADPNRSRTLDLEYLCKDGSQYWSETKFTFLRDENGQATGILGVGRDVTARKKVETEREKLRNQLLQAQKMEAVGHLAGGVAHDFNNMLSIVIGNTELAMMELGPDDDMQSKLKSIHYAAQRSSNMVRQLLGFARKQTINPIVLDINDTIAGMLSMLRRLIGEDIHLAWLPGHETAKVKIDPSQIDQILANLTVNARDAIGGVGRVTIETENREIDQVYCDGHAGFVPGSYVMLAVSDDGCGMDSATVAQIFEPFFSTKTDGKGTGLGLATVYGIVKQNKGFINVYSEPGQGTTFRIYLPGIDEPAQRLETEYNPLTLPKGAETILIVEDDEAILMMAQLSLNQLGYRVITAEHPDKALDIAQTHGQKIDLLLTDVIMPLMNGRELAERMEKIRPGLKCLYMSGYTADVIAHHGVLEDGVCFISKPFSLRDLAFKIREVLDG